MEIISTHINADMDSFASMIAASKLYPQAVLVFPGSKNESLRHFLRSGLFQFSESKIKNIKAKEIERIILVDIRQLSRIGALAEILRKYPEIELHIYDHHPPKKGDLKGSIEVVKQVGSTTTILVDILKKKGIELQPMEATVMAMGIYEDTGLLTFPSTRENDLLVVAYLLSQGADLSLIPRFLKEGLSSKQIALLNELMLGAETHFINGVKVVIASMQKNKYFTSLAILTQKYMDMENLDVVFSLVQMGNKIHLIARNRLKNIDVGEIVAAFGGGGHPSAASAIIKEATLIEAKEKLLAEMKEKMKPLKKAKDIMNTFLITVTDKDKVSDALEIMNKYRINAIPVKRGSMVIGMVSRQIVDRAIFHHLNNSSVEEIMAEEFKIIPPDEELQRIEKMMIESNLRFVLVGESADKVQGIITRMELFRQLYFLRMEETELYESRQAASQNIRPMMAKRIPPRLFSLLRSVCHTADQYEFRAYLVGGFVRDLFLNIDNIDIDIVVEGDGIEFAQRLARKLKARIKSHQKFGTAVVILPDGFKLDVATARTEYYEEPGSLPVVKESVLRLDLFRRDFTINTLAVRLNQAEFGQLIDFFGGLRDLKQGLIRVLHTLSFIEDPTRAFRAVRFQHRLDFRIEPHTLSLLSIAAKRGVFHRVSGSRLLNELKLIFEGENASTALTSLAELGLLKFIQPKLKISQSIRNTLRSLDNVITWHKFLYQQKKPRNWLLYLMALAQQLSQEDKEELCQRLSIVGDARDIILNYKKQTDHFISQLALQSCFQPSDIYSLLQPFPLEMLLYAMAKDIREKVKRQISRYLTELVKVKLKITGEDLILIGLKAGPAIGEILYKIHIAKLNGLVKSKEEEIAYARSLMD